jgi:ketosteroid isomerase-like protein
MGSMSTAVTTPGLAVSRWVDAFNARDIDRLLADLHPEIVLHPLRFPGLAGGYHGHDGVREWFEHQVTADHGPCIELSVVEVAADGRVLAAGNLCLDGEVAIAPFGAIHRFERGMIIDAHHYFSDQTLLRRLGLFP